MSLVPHPASLSAFHQFGGFEYRVSYEAHGFFYEGGGYLLLRFLVGEAVIGAEALIRHVARALGNELVPVGEHEDGIALLCLDERGQVYSILTETFALRWPNIEAALACVVMHDGEPEELAIPP